MPHSSKVSTIKIKFCNNAAYSRPGMGLSKRQAADRDAGLKELATRTAIRASDRYGPFVDRCVACSGRVKNRARVSIRLANAWAATVCCGSALPANQHPYVCPLKTADISALPIPNPLLCHSLSPGTRAIACMAKPNRLRIASGFLYPRAQARVLPDEPYNTPMKYGMYNPNSAHEPYRAQRSLRFPEWPLSRPRASQQACPGRAGTEGTRRQHPEPGHSLPSLEAGHSGAEDWAGRLSASSVHASPPLANLALTRLPRLRSLCQ